MNITFTLRSVHNFAEAFLSSSFNSTAVPSSDLFEFKLSSILKKRLWTKVFKAEMKHYTDKPKEQNKLLKTFNLTAEKF